MVGRDTRSGYSPVSVVNSLETEGTMPTPSSPRTTDTYVQLSMLKGKLVHEFNTNWKGRPYKLGGGATTLVLLVILLFRGSSNGSSTTTTTTTTASSWREHFDWRSTREDKSVVVLVPGELPGYTGWARPGTTLAGHFQLVAPLDIWQPATAGSIWEMTVQCFHSECATGGALFFVRAYGPSVLSGKVTDGKDGSYKIELLPKDPGAYTVEVVLTFSNPPSFGHFPLPKGQPEPGYEGYLLPNFPLPLQVLAGGNSNDKKKKTIPMCAMEDLLETSPTSAWEKNRWLVTDKINQPHHVDDPDYKDVTFPGYQQSHNSLGIQMEYQYDNCQILPALTPGKSDSPINKCAKEKGPLNFIFIGDSNMRLQRNIFEELFLGLPEDEREKSRYNEHNIRATYFDITGGALKCNIEGGDKNVTRLFETIKARVDDTLETPERYVILFNTGMHDIHRLCSREFERDRVTYLGDSATDTSQGFHCVQHYRMAVAGLAQEVFNFPAALRVFQSTTAGWPKYGNFDVTWPPEGQQNMPVATEFIDFFNYIAYDVMKDSFPTIPVMDGYYISYARPDNREIALGTKKALERKLSHPGLEVVLALLRQWTTIVAQSETCAGP